VVRYVENIKMNIAQFENGHFMIYGLCVLRPSCSKDVNEVYHSAYLEKTCVYI